MRVSSLCFYFPGLQIAEQALGYQAEGKEELRDSQQLSPGCFLFRVFVRAANIKQREGTFLRCPEMRIKYQGTEGGPWILSTAIAPFYAAI